MCIFYTCNMCAPSLRFLNSYILSLAKSWKSFYYFNPTLPKKLFTSLIFDKILRQNIYLKHWRE